MGAGRKKKKGMTENNMAKNGGERTKRGGAGAHGMRCRLQQWNESNGDNL